MIKRRQTAEQVEKDGSSIERGGERAEINLIQARKKKKSKRRLPTEKKKRKATECLPPSLSMRRGGATCR